MTEPEPIQPCPTDGHCHGYWPGHHMHSIHAGKIGETPWDWRAATVAKIDPDGTIALIYPDGHRLTAWHHQDLSDEIAVSDIVLVHERWYGLNFGENIVNVVIRDGQALPIPRTTRRPGNRSCSAASSTWAPAGA